MQRAAAARRGLRRAGWDLWRAGEMPLPRESMLGEQAGPENPCRCQLVSGNTQLPLDCIRPSQAAHRPAQRCRTASCRPGYRAPDTLQPTGRFSGPV